MAPHKDKFYKQNWKHYGGLIFFLHLLEMEQVFTLIQRVPV